MIDGEFRISLYDESVKFPDLRAGKAIRHFMPDDIHAARGPVFGKPTPWQAISASSLRSDLGGLDVDNGEGEGHVA